MDGERLNIWGKPGCELPSGKLCVACCNYFTITEFDSPAGEKCIFAVPGKGCSIVFEREKHNESLVRLREKICRPYHCSQSDSITQWGLRLTALHMRQVTREEFTKSGGK